MIQAMFAKAVMWGQAGRRWISAVLNFKAPSEKTKCEQSECLPLGFQEIVLTQYNYLASFPHSVCWDCSERNDICWSEKQSFIGGINSVPWGAV